MIIRMSSLSCLKRRLCNMNIISHVQQVICFAFHDSRLLMETCQEAKNMRKIVTLFYLDWKKSHSHTLFGLVGEPFGSLGRNYWVHLTHYYCTNVLALFKKDKMGFWNLIVFTCFKREIWIMKMWLCVMNECVGCTE